MARLSSWGSGCLPSDSGSHHGRQLVEGHSSARRAHGSMTKPPGRRTSEAMTRRDFARIGLAGLMAGPGSLGTLGGERSLVQARRPVPTAGQLEWQRDELALFLHFG